MSDGFCAFFDSGNGHGKSGFYISGCTDPHVNSPGCPGPQYTNIVNDVVWGGDSQRWNWCGQDGSDNVDCYPSSSTDLGPQLASGIPGQLALRPLATIQGSSTVLPLTTSSPLSSAATATVTVAATTGTAASASTDCSDQASAVSPGTIAAIVLGVILALSWIGAGIYLIRKGHSNRESSQMAQSSYESVPLGPKSAPTQIQEVGTESGRSQLHETPLASELPDRWHG